MAKVSDKSRIWCPVLRSAIYTQPMMKNALFYDISQIAPTFIVFNVCMNIYVIRNKIFLNTTLFVYFDANLNRI